jgi:hypothetical protein
VSVPVPFVGSVWRLGALVSGGIVAIPGTSRPGCGGLAVRRTRGQRRPTPRPRRYRHAGLGALHDQAEGSPDDGPEQGAHDDQNLAAMTKRSVHRASMFEHDPDNVASAHEPKRRPLDLGLSADQLNATEICCLALSATSRSARNASA